MVHTSNGVLWKNRVGFKLVLRRVCCVVNHSLSGLKWAALAEIGTGGLSGPLYAEGLSISLCAHLSHNYSDNAPERRLPMGLSQGQLRNVKEYVSDHLTAPLSVQDLAKSVNLSSAHFARCFKRMTGQSPIAYVMSKRLERARRLIEMGVSLRETAKRSGFCDQAHLTHQFEDMAAAEV